MPVYNINGKKIRTEVALSDQQIDEIASELGQGAVQEPQSTIDVGNAPTSGLVMGLKDPISAGAQLLPRGLGFVSSVGGLAPNSLSDWFNSEAQRVDAMVKQDEAGYQASRRQKGESGFDLERLAGNIVNPANLVPGALVRGSALTKSVATGAMTGAMQPVVGDGSFAEEKLTQAATGAVLGPLFEGVVKGGVKVKDIFKRVTPKGREKALRDYLIEATGPEKEAVIKALQDAKEFVTGSRPTAAEALSDIPSASQLMAIQKKLSRDPAVGAGFKVLQENNRIARQTLIDSIAKTDAERKLVEEARSGVFKNIGAKALDSANEASRVLNELQGAVNLKFKNVVDSKELEKQLPLGWAGFAAGTKPRVDSAAKTVYSDQVKKFQLDSLAQSGYFPLLASDIVSPIDKALKMTIDDDSKLILNGMKQDILSRADSNGIVNSNDLYENVRKVLNQKVSVYLNKGDKPFQGGLPQTAAKTADNIKKMIDASLNKTTQGAWGKYLNDYAKYSKQLDRMAVGEALSKKLNSAVDKEKALSFATAVEEATSLIKTSTGLPRYSNLADILEPAEVKKVQSVLADLQRKAKSEELGAGLRTAEIDVGATLPNVLSQPIAFTNIFLRHLANGNAGKVTAAAAPLFQDPKKLAAFINNVPEPNIVMKLLARVSPDTQRTMLQAIAIKPIQEGLRQ